MPGGRAHDRLRGRFPTHKMPFESPYRGRGKPGKYGKLPQGMGWKITEWTDHLYTIPQEDPYALAPGAKFTWTRMRVVGGRTNVWGRSCDRFGPLDFKGKSQQDGFGEDWPVSYDDVVALLRSDRKAHWSFGNLGRRLQLTLRQVSAAGFSSPLRGVAGPARRGEAGHQGAAPATGGDQPGL